MSESNNNQIKMIPYTYIFTTFNLGCIQININPPKIKLIHNKLFIVGIKHNYVWKQTAIYVQSDVNYSSLPD